MTVRVIEIRVIENIEELGAELEIALFVKGKFLVHCEIPIFKARTAADGALGSVVELTEWWVSEVIRIKPEAAIRLWILFLEWRDAAGRFGTQEENAGGQLGIVFSIEANGETTLELRNP